MVAERIQSGSAPRRSIGEGADRRRRIRREVAWLVVVKFVALTLLWFLFFSPVHRHHVDGDVASRQFGVAQAATPAQKENTRD
jgi:hypothetical protein